MGIPYEWEHKYAKIGMGMGGVHVTMGMRMANFACVPKFSSVETETDELLHTGMGITPDGTWVRDWERE